MCLLGRVGTLTEKTTRRSTIGEGAGGAGADPELVAPSFSELSFFGGGGAGGDATTGELPVHVRRGAPPVADPPVWPLTGSVAPAAGV
jgi:hypothetical protein